LILANDLKLRRAHLVGAASVSLIIALAVYGLVFYDGRNTIQRIVDCEHHAGYTTTVTHNVEYPDNGLLSGLLPSSPTRSTTVTTSRAHEDWWAMVTFRDDGGAPSYTDSIITGSAAMPPRDHKATFNCMAPFL
jgi:hypothetical protein